MMTTMFLIPALCFVWVICFVGSLVIIDEAFDTELRWNLKEFIVKLCKHEETEFKE